MIKSVTVNKLTVGDWLYEDVKVKGKIIKSTWNGLSKKEINLLRKSKNKVKVRYGIPYAPVFFLAFLTLVFLYFLKIIPFLF